MEAGTLLAKLTERGIAVEVDGPDLVVRPGSRLTDADRAAIRSHKADLLAALKADQERTATGHLEYLGRLAQAPGGPMPTLPTMKIGAGDVTAGMMLIRICRENSVGLRLDPDGTLVVESHGRAWRALVDDLERHVDEVAQLIEAGWCPFDA